jgi:type I restriction enzyme, S subunit
MSEVLEAHVGEQVRRWQPYPAYKDSGVEWLGEIPEHWNVERVSKHARLINGFPFASENFDREGGTPLVRIRDLETETTEIFYRGPEPDEAKIDSGDIIIGMDGEFEIARWRGGAALLNQRMCSLRPTETVDQRFLAYTLPFPLRAINDITHSTTVKHLSSGQVRRIKLGFPPRSEQSQISDFLDRETAKIDALIAKKKELILLLREQKRAGANRLVVGGEVRPGGVDDGWVSGLPERWKAVSVNRLASFITSGSRGWADFYGPEGAAFLRIGNLRRDSVDLRLDAIQRVEPPLGAETERTQARPGDVVVSITAYIGSVGVIPDDLGEAYVNQHLALIRLRDGACEPRWLANCLLSEVGRQQFDLLLYGGTKDGLGLDDVGNVVVPLPPLDEQKRLVSEMDEMNRGIHRLVERINGGIVALHQYRAALISATVTGKIDVREAA